MMGHEPPQAPQNPPLRLVMRDISGGEGRSDEEETVHKNVPQGSPEALYGLVGDVARVGASSSEASPYAIALNFLVYLSACIGRGPCLPVGNTFHHARLFGLHIGRSGRGRKGDAVALVTRIDQSLREMDTAHSTGWAPQVHRGGLSTREGLVMLIHDGYQFGRQSAEPIQDKRLWVQESEFANVLHQARRTGNALSTALRDCWDGMCLKPATKTNRLYASHPHVAVTGAITPHELKSLMSSRDMSNGFANRFLMVWAERSQVLPFPQSTPVAKIEALARRVQSVLAFAQAQNMEGHNQLAMRLSPQAQTLYAELYRSELGAAVGGERVIALL